MLGVLCIYLMYPVISSVRHFLVSYHFVQNMAIESVLQAASRADTGFKDIPIMYVLPHVFRSSYYTRLPTYEFTQLLCKPYLVI